MADLRKYGVADSIVFPLIDGGTTDYEDTPVAFASGDSLISKDFGAFTSTTNLPAHEGQGIYTVALTSAELGAKKIQVTIRDLTATEAWEDQGVNVETYGHASAQHPFDLGTASVPQTADHTAGIADIPTVAEFNARTLVAASYFDPAADAVADVTLVATTTTNSDMRGTDSAATAAALASLTNALILTTATIETVTSQTVFVLPATADATDNDAYNGAIAVFIDGTDPNQKSYRLVTDYASGTRSVTVSAAPDFTITTADTIAILATGTAANVWDRVLTGATHNLSSSAGRRLRNIQDFGIYDMASVWVDEVAGTSTGTTDGEDGTVANRSNDFDNAQTIASSVGLDNIHVQNGNSITLAATINNFNIWSGPANSVGVWTLLLGGRDIGGCTVNGANVSGTGIGTTPEFISCDIGTATLSPCQFIACRLTATLTLGSAGNFQFIDCVSGVAGSSAPVIDMGGAVGATNLELRRWSGGLTLNNVQAGDVVSVDVVSGGTITVNGTGGTVVIRGHCNVVDGSGASVTITETSVVNMTKINTEADTALTDYGALKPTTASRTLDVSATGEASADTTLISGSTAAADNLEESAKGIETGAALTGTLTTTTMTTDLSEATDDHYIGRIVTFITGVNAKQSTDITDYSGTSGFITMTALTAPPGNGDTFVIT